MSSASPLALFDAQVRQSTQPDQPGVEEMFAVHHRAFSTDRLELRQSLLDRLAAAPDSFAMMIAFHDAEPVSAARIEFSPGADFAGLWGRHRPGLAQPGAVPRAGGRPGRLAVARGYRYLQMDALPTSQPILTRLGFTPLARTTPSIWDPVVAPRYAARLVTGTRPTAGIPAEGGLWSS